jgi:hypothetical protein
MFIRKKIVNDTTYYALVENERTKNGRVKQRVIVSLGTFSTIEGALVAARNAFESFTREAETAERVRPAGFRGWKFEAKTARARAERYGREIEKLESAQRRVKNSIGRSDGF